MSGRKIKKVRDRNDCIIPHEAIMCFTINNLVVDVRMCCAEVFQHTAAQTERSFTVSVFNGIQGVLYGNCEIESEAAKVVGVKFAGNLEQSITVDHNLAFFVNNRLRRCLFRY